MGKTLEIFLSHVSHYFGLPIASGLLKMIENSLLKCSLFSDIDAVCNANSECFTKLHHERLNYYHTSFHCFNLAYRIDELAFRRNVSDVARFEIVAMMLAAFYHDCNHTFGEKADLINVSLAKQKFLQDMADNRKTFDTIELNCPGFSNLVIQLIEYSKYPYVAPSENVELIQTFRFLDAAEAIDDNYHVSLKGLFSEMKNSLASDVTFETFLQKYAEFLQSLNEFGFLDRCLAEQIKTKAVKNVLSAESFTRD